MALNRLIAATQLCHIFVYVLYTCLGGGASLSPAKTEVDESYFVNETTRLSIKLAETIGKNKAIFTALRNICEAAETMISSTKLYVANTHNLLQSVQSAKRGAERSLSILNECVNNYFTPPKSQFNVKFTITETLEGVHSAFNRTLNATEVHCAKTFLVSSVKTMTLATIAEKSEETLSAWLSMEAHIRKGSREPFEIYGHAAGYINRERTVVRERYRDWANTIDEVGNRYLYELSQLAGNKLVEGENMTLVLSNLTRESKNAALEEENRRNEAEARFREKVDSLKDVLCDKVTEVEKLKGELSSLETMISTVSMKTSASVKSHADVLQKYSLIQKVCGIVIVCAEAVEKGNAGSVAAERFMATAKEASNSAERLVENAKKWQDRLRVVEDNMSGIRREFMNSLERFGVKNDVFADKNCSRWRIVVSLPSVDLSERAISLANKLNSDNSQNKGEIAEIASKVKAFLENASAVLVTSEAGSKGMEGASKTINEAVDAVTVAVRLFFNESAKSMCETNELHKYAKGKVDETRGRYEDLHLELPVTRQKVETAKLRVSQTRMMVDEVMRKISEKAASYSVAEDELKTIRAEMDLDAVDFTADVAVSDSERAVDKLQVIIESVADELSSERQQLESLKETLKSKAAQFRLNLSGLGSPECSVSISGEPELQHVNVGALAELLTNAHAVGHVQNRLRHVVTEINDTKIQLSNIMHVLQSAREVASRFTRNADETERATRNTLQKVLECVKVSLCESMSELRLLGVNCTLAANEAADAMKQLAAEKKRARVANVAAVGVARDSVGAQPHAQMALDAYLKMRTISRKGSELSNSVISTVQESEKSAMLRIDEIKGMLMDLVKNVTGNDTPETLVDICDKDLRISSSANKWINAAISISDLSELVNITNFRSSLETIELQVKQLHKLRSHASLYADAVESAAEAAKQKAKVDEESKLSLCVPLYKQLLKLL
ncbi:hypothetical protein TRVL_07929 [Trypanosoma vivax]|nr:hypothetical protein TRVL_07929 [Trypanosoma vivax]